MRHIIMLASGCVDVKVRTLRGMAREQDREQAYGQDRAQDCGQNRGQ